MKEWSEINLYGIVISNFIPNQTHALKLTIGEFVHILEECDHWYYGYSLYNKKKLGIFPKNFINIKNEFNSKTMPIIDKISAVLREWNTSWQKLYITSNKHFEEIRQMMNELIDFRRDLITDILPVVEIKELTKKMTATIDRGNAILGLDLIVENEDKIIHIPETTSIIDLYRAHEAVTQRINQNEESDKKRLSFRHNHNLYVSVRDFNAYINEEIELLFSLFDSKEGIYISENYCLKLGKNGFNRDLGQLNDFHFLFTDLSSKDIVREKVYLVCQAIRMGKMFVKEDFTLYAQDRSVVDKYMVNFEMKYLSDNTQSDSVIMRRPFGIAVLDLTDYLRGRTEMDEQIQNFCQFYRCSDKYGPNSLTEMFGRITTNDMNDEIIDKTLGIWVSFKLLHGNRDQIREEYAHLVSPFTLVAHKIGFPEVINPTDARNDLYINLVMGELSNSCKRSDPNIEVTVTVCDSKGRALENCLNIGAGGEMTSEYKSVVYYHDKRPKWMETLNISIGLEEYFGSHIKLTYRHRSSYDSKEKYEKPFAMSFLKLMTESGTVVNDQMHNLLVYKYDHKRYDDSFFLTYLKLPATRQELEARLPGGGQQMSAKQLSNMFCITGLTICSKDSFTLSTVICSTRLTQNIHLLGLLNWKLSPEKLETNLLALMKLNGEEVVKFLKDILNSLFDIIMDNTQREVFDSLVFEALISIISLISDRRYEHFRKVLDLYIEHTFREPLVYNKLIIELKFYIEKVNSNETENQEILLKVMKSLEYIFKFIVRSRVLYSTLNEGKGREEFEESLKKLLQSITSMMCSTSEMTILIQGECLKCLPFALTHVLPVFDEKVLRFILTDLIKNVRIDRLTKLKLLCVNDIVHSLLFPKCRSTLLPVICDQLRILLDRNEEMELCLKLISHILNVLTTGADFGDIQNDISYIMITLLQSLIWIFIDMNRENNLMCGLVSIIISILRQMNSFHYKQYIKRFANSNELIEFLSQLLIVFKDLIRSVFPKTWNEMILLQNSVLLSSLKHIGAIIREEFYDPFTIQIWINFFNCSAYYITQDSLQLENFSESKRNKIIKNYGDMRKTMALEVISLWTGLGKHQIRFVQLMVKPFLEIALIPDTELRSVTIGLLFDLIRCEFYSENTSTESTPEDKSVRKANFKLVEYEMVTQLSHLIERGRGDQKFIDLFDLIFITNFETKPEMRDSGVLFVKTIVKLMNNLLEYRSVVNYQNNEILMNCYVKLLEFYNDIERQDMYLKILYNLYDLHMEYNNHIEAAYTLALHSRLLKWTDEPLDVEHYRSHEHIECRTHHELKVVLFDQIIEHFDRGKLWEMGITYCKKIVNQLENEMQFNELMKYLEKKKQLFSSIITENRYEPEYFRVGFYGKGFPLLVRNKDFVFRGKEYEKISEFSGRILRQFNKAVLMDKLDPPGDDILESPNGQYLQINKVDPVMQEREELLHNKFVDENILHYYRVNDIKMFTYSRPKRSSDSNNDFSNLWVVKTDLYILYALPGISRSFAVFATNTSELSPLENAIQTIDNNNNKICNLIVRYSSNTSISLDPLSLTLNGIVDAAVNGGIALYEEAFFNNSTQEFEEEGLERLRDSIASQIPLLEVGISIHSERIPTTLLPLQQHMEGAFNKLKYNVETRYGRRSLPKELRKKLRLNNVGSNRSPLRNSYSSQISSEFDNISINSSTNEFLLDTPQKKPTKSIFWSKNSSLKKISQIFGSSTTLCDIDMTTRYNMEQILEPQPSIEDTTSTETMETRDMSPETKKVSENSRFNGLWAQKQVNDALVKELQTSFQTKPVLAKKPVKKEEE